MLLPGRHGEESSQNYRYGFQGQEDDPEIKGKGNSTNYKYRMHDPRIGRFFAVDPLASSYPWYTPYQFSGNKVIAWMELEGLEETGGGQNSTQSTQEQIQANEARIQELQGQMEVIGFEEKISNAEVRIENFINTHNSNVTKLWEAKSELYEMKWGLEDYKFADQSRVILNTLNRVYDMAAYWKNPYTYDSGLGGIKTMSYWENFGRVAYLESPMGQAQAHSFNIQAPQIDSYAGFFDMPIGLLTGVVSEGLQLTGMSTSTANTTANWTVGIASLYLTARVGSGSAAVDDVVVHGNSLASLKPTWGYKLYSQDGTFLKNGITSKPIPEKRYTRAFMSDKYMVPHKQFPNRREAYNWEYQQNVIQRGPLNLNMH